MRWKRDVCGYAHRCASDLADTRKEALPWEQEYYWVGGPGWKARW